MASDEELACAVQHGSQMALEILVARYYPLLLRFLFHMVGGSRSDAEDLVQETLIRMMRGIHSYDPARPFKPWVYAIARNLTSNHAARRDMQTVPLYEHSTDNLALPEYALMTHELHQDVLQGLAQLPVKQREAIVLFYYNELPQKEIAALLHIPVGTVKSRLSLGLKQLRSWLETHA